MSSDKTTSQGNVKPVKKQRKEKWYVQMEADNITKQARSKAKKRQMKQGPENVAYKRFIQEWTLDEKKTFLEAAKKNKDISEISEKIPSRTTDEIKKYYDKMKARGERQAQTEPMLKAPIELWLSSASELTAQCQDFSHLIAHVLSICGNLEPHYEPRNRSQPNYKRVYGYMAALIKDEETPALEPIEATIVLELLQGVADQLRLLNTDKQRELMAAKYQLLNEHVQINNKRASDDAVRRALQEDLLEPTPPDTEEIKETGPEDMEASTSSQQASTSSQQASTSSQQASTSSQQASTSSQQASTSSQQDSPSSQQASTSSQQASTSSPQPSMRGVRPKKTALYTLNPFCIPVKYLNPERRERIVIEQKLPAANKGKTEESGVPAITDVT